MDAKTFLMEARRKEIYEGHCGLFGAVLRSVTEEGIETEIKKVEDFSKRNPVPYKKVESAYVLYYYVAGKYLSMKEVFLSYEKATAKMNADIVNKVSNEGYRLIEMQISDEENYRNAFFERDGDHGALCICLKKVWLTK